MSKVRVAIGVLLVVAGVLQVAADADRGPTENDLVVDYASAKEVRAGGSAYTPLVPLVRRHVVDDGRPLAYPPEQRNPHPPTAILVALPFTLLSFDAFRYLWLFLSILCLVIGCYAAARAFGYSEHTAALIGVAVFALPVTHDALVTLQIEPILLAVTLYGWIAITRGRDRLGGSLLGLVVAAKIYPVIMLVALGRRQRRALAWGAVAAGTFSILSVLVVGWGDASLWATKATEQNIEIWGTAYYNLSLPGLVLKAVAGTWEPVPGWAPLLYAGAFLIAVAYAARVDVLDAAPAMALVAPIAWTTYALFTMPAVIRGGRRDARALWFVGAALVGGGVAAQDLAVFLPTLGLALMMVAAFRGRMGVPEPFAAA